MVAPVALTSHLARSPAASSRQTRVSLPYHISSSINFLIIRLYDTSRPFLKEIIPVVAFIRIAHDKTSKYHELCTHWCSLDFSTEMMCVPIYFFDWPIDWSMLCTRMQRRAGVPISWRVSGAHGTGSGSCDDPWRYTYYAYIIFINVSPAGQEYRYTWNVYNLLMSVYIIYFTRTYLYFMYTYSHTRANRFCQDCCHRERRWRHWPHCCHHYQRKHVINA